MPQDFFYYDPSQKPVAGTPLDLQHFAAGAAAIYPMWEGAGISIEDVVNGNTGTMGRDVSWGVDRTLVFSGITGNIDCGPALNPSLFGISTLIYRNGSQNSFAMIACSAFSVSSGGFQLYHYGTTNHLGGFVDYSDGTNSGDIDTGYLIPNQTWTHVAMTLDGRNLTFYANGIQVFQQAALGKTLRPTTNHLRIGCNSADSGNIFFGSMANLILLSGVVTPDQIKELSERPYGMFYHPRVFPLHIRKSTMVRPRGPTWRNINSIVPNSERPEVGTPINVEANLAQNIVAYWPFWEGAGKLTEDIVGNNTGIITGNPVWQNGLLFDGTTNNVVVKNGAILGNSSFGTISFKVAPSSVLGRSIYAENTSGGVIFSLCMDASNHFVMQIKQSNGLFVQAISSTIALAGVEYTATTTFSAVNGLRLYINGRLEATGPWDGTIYALGGAITKTLIGDFINAGSFKWGGSMQSGILLNMELNASQVSALYGDPYVFFTRHRAGSSASLVAAKTYVSSRRLDVKDATQKPEAGVPLDLDHWASKAVAIWPMWEGSGQQIEDVIGTKNATLNSGISWGSDGIVFDGVTGMATINGSLPPSPNITLWALIRVDSTGSTQHISCNDNSHSSGGRVWQFRLTSSGTLQAIFFTVTNTLGSVIGSSVVAGTGVHLVAVTWDGVTIRLYVDGKLDGTTLFSGTITNIQTDPATIGNGASAGQAGSAPLKGIIYQHGISYSVLTPDQVKELYERPYEMFSQNRRGRSVVMPARLKVAGPRGVSSPGVQQSNDSPIPGTPINTDSDLATGLVAYWPCWEGSGRVVEDVGGNGWTATSNADLIWQQTQRGTAPFFSNTAILNVAKTNWIHVVNSTTKGYTFGAWIYPTSSTRRTVFADWDNTGNNNSFTLEMGGSGTPAGHWASDHWVTTSTNYIVAPTAAILNQWTHVVITWDGKNTRKMYVDGNLVATQQSITSWGTGITNSNQSFIGNYAPSLTDANSIRANLKDMVIYNYALSADQVAQLYNEPYEFFKPKRSRVAAVANLPVSGNVYNISASGLAIVSGIGSYYLTLTITPVSGVLAGGTGLYNSIWLIQPLGGAVVSGSTGSQVTFQVIGQSGGIGGGLGVANCSWIVRVAGGAVAAGLGDYFVLTQVTGGVLGSGAALASEIMNMLSQGGSFGSGAAVISKWRDLLFFKFRVGDIVFLADDLKPHRVNAVKYDQVAWYLLDNGAWYQDSELFAGRARADGLEAMVNRIKSKIDQMNRLPTTPSPTSQSIFILGTGDEVFYLDERNFPVKGIVSRATTSGGEVKYILTDGKIVSASSLISRADAQATIEALISKIRRQ